MSKKIHFNSFDLPTVDKTVLPHMVYNLDGNEYYVKTKKAENSDKKVGVGCLKFGDYEWLIKNSWGLVLPTDCSWYMYNNYSSTYKTMTVLPNELQDTDASNVANMCYMFSNCEKLTTISPLDTSNVTNISGMFYDCKSLTTIPLLDTSKVTNMNAIFNECTSLITMPQLNTSNVTNMKCMFYECSSLTTISPLNTSNVTNMNWMFNKCTSLTTIPQLVTSKVTNMSSMFEECKSLPSVFPWVIDCSSISSIDGIQNIFRGSSVTEVTFNNVKASLASQFTAANLGSQLTKITIQSTI